MAIVVIALAAAAVLALSGCAGPDPKKRFTPLPSDRTAVAEPAARGGEPPAAFHDLAFDDRPVGEVEVWSRGVVAPPPGVDDGAAGPAAVHVGVRIRNDGDRAIALDVGSVGLDVELPLGERLSPRAPAIDGDLPIADPAEVARFDLYFGLPPGIEPERVRGFELAWAVDVGVDHIEATTTFARTDLVRPPGPIAGSRAVYLPLGTMIYYPTSAHRHFWHY